MRSLLLALALLAGGCTAFEDGSAVIPLGAYVVVIPAFDSPGDAISVRGLHSADPRVRREAADAIRRLLGR